MKKTFIIILSVLTIGFISCKKSSPTLTAAQQAGVDDGLIKTYISTHNIDSVKKDSASGIYYKIVAKGTGAYPTASSTVIVNYQGMLLNGSVFAPQGNLGSPLVDLISGWQIGLPFINTGGTIMLLLPSRYGYGDSSPSPTIPNNSVLIFTIQLISFTN
ncbi:FKBP-type peptidyl-prolyl cis-trans isomerase [Mucilaginibacter sp. E4BP6]|uniref:FKBP-type peptidyl-prolyl cis-trans isomerase n=1 Tax=Mucilaginibacter sp. E4BP6 TaxID=2723089 RepID=UPI0015C857B3|nr:FKBP-type peptidyl-prolyl cis-trans isomerase [Mucilaginibacter sp. E4BP6]NYE66815.1 FKBP-type peptidyl-prolyl cis-trans isomerase [Mucilaginibacter sp. E4BP6]